MTHCMYKSTHNVFFFVLITKNRGPPFNQILNKFDWRKIVCQKDQREESIVIILIHLMK